MRKILTRSVLVSACGFGLSKAATSIGYLSAMGSVSHNIGFVTELWFMLASEAASLAFAVVVGTRAANGRLAMGSLPQWPAVLVLMLGFCCGSAGLLAALPEHLEAGVLGLLYGFSSFVFCVTWLEEFSYCDSRTSHVSMASGLVVQTVVVMAVSFVPAALSFVSIFIALVSYLCYEESCRLFSRVARTRERSFEPVTARAFVARFGTPFACLFVLVGVVGILHTSVLGSSFEHIVGGVSMWMPLAVATALTAAIAAISLKSPDPSSTYKAVLPVMLVLLSLLPFFGDILGPLAGAVMIACYDVSGMLFLFFIVDTAFTHKQQNYLLSSVYMGGSNAFLAMGLGIGLLLNGLSGDYGISLMTLLAFVAIYPLCIVFVLVVRRTLRDVRFPSSSGEESPAARRADASSDPSRPSSTVEPDWEGALAAFAARYRLTKRESEICSYLVRGRSAKRIAEELFISENTVWTHTKNVYAKTKVSGKDALIDLFEHEALRK